MLNELKEIFELADMDNSCLLDKREFNRYVAPVLGLTAKAIKNAKLIKNTFNFQELCKWFSSLKPNVSRHIFLLALTDLTCRLRTR